MVGVKSNLLSREARRPRRLGPVRMVSLYGTFSSDSLLSILVISLINQDLVGRLLVYLPSIFGAYIRVLVDITRGQGERTRAIFGSKTHKSPAVAP